MFNDNEKPYLLEISIDIDKLWKRYDFNKLIHIIDKLTINYNDTYYLEKLKDVLYSIKIKYKIDFLLVLLFKIEQIIIYLNSYVENDILELSHKILRLNECINLIIEYYTHSKIFNTLCELFMTHTQDTRLVTVRTTADKLRYSRKLLFCEIFGIVNNSENIFNKVQEILQAEEKNIIQQ